jgi:Ca2+-binding EF-hand superfamily protein
MCNGIFEPMGTTHNDRPVWCSRSLQSLYLFHTGKSRWVVSKRVDDGTTCYAFIQDTSNDPLQAKGKWQTNNKDNEWEANPSVSLKPVPPSNDKFVQLRMSVEEEMKKYNLNDTASLKALWKTLDFNGNNVVSLAEIDKLVVEMVQGGTWPDWLNNKPALMRAYKKTILKDGDGDDWVEKPEFHALLLNIFWFNKLWKIFDLVDTGDDRRVDVNEFAQGIGALGLQLSPSEAKEEFSKIDADRGGQILFVEFCAWVRKRVNPDDNPGFDADIYSGTHCGKTMRKHHGHKATHTNFVKKKDLSCFDDLEKKVKAIMADKKQLKDLWHHLDFNGNNIVSLAEIDKLAVEKFPLLNHKPALMRAYKATLKGFTGSTGDKEKRVKDDDWVHKKDFKCLLGNLFYFNKLFWIFNMAADQEHHNDRRMDYKEFKFCLNVCRCKMSEQEMKADFAKVDKNGGGMILFNEFCLYFTHKACPQAMQEMVD